MLGLKALFKSVKDSLKVTRLSFESCELDLRDEEGQEIVQLLQQNISLIEINYQCNYNDIAFHQGIEQEVELNKAIVEKIFPQLRE